MSGPETSAKDQAPGSEGADFSFTRSQVLCGPGQARRNMTRCSVVESWTTFCQCLLTRWRMKRVFASVKARMCSRSSTVPRTTQRATCVLVGGVCSCDVFVIDSCLTCLVCQCSQLMHSARGPGSAMLTSMPWMSTAALVKPPSSAIVFRPWCCVYCAHCTGENLRG